MIAPPPSKTKLTNERGNNSTWVTWFYNLYEQVRKNMTLTAGISFDAFGRARTSNPETIFDSKQIHDKQPLFWAESTTGSGAAGTWSQDTASTIMDVDATTAGSITRQTFRRFNYQPGKSQLIFLTFVLDKSGGGTGITRQVGIFDDNNGIFLEDAEGSIQLVLRTSTSGSPADTDIAQTAWNIDKMNGAGVSGKTIDWAKSQILIIDYEWLGVGRVRIGFVIDGEIYYVHQFLNTNVLSQVYMSTPNLPLRYYISNDGTGAASTLEHICATVISEGGNEEIGPTRYQSIDNSQVQANTIGTLYAVCGIRLKSGNLDATVKPVSVTMLCETTDDYQWVFLINPTVAGSPTWANETNSTIQFGTADTTGNPSTTTVTGGTKIAGGYVKSSNQSGDVTNQLNTAQLLGADIAGTPDEMWLCVMPLATNADIHGGIQWKEIS